MAEHLIILEPDEIYDLYAIPVFDEIQKALFFGLTELEQQEMQRYRTPVSKLYFILQLGYFKAKQQFYLFDLNDVAADRDYLWERYFSQEIIPAFGSVSKPTRLTQQKVILALQQFQIANKAIREKLLDRACLFAKRHSKPIYIFRELIPILNSIKLCCLVILRCND